MTSPQGPSWPDPDCSGLGLALSGGGLRAAAFHVGTLVGLRDLGMLESIKVVSAVSGGAILGAVWVRSQSGGQPFDDFQKDFNLALRRGLLGGVGLVGFIVSRWSRDSGRHPLSALLRSKLIGASLLRDLPSLPALHINATVLDTGQLGRFSREGFSTTGLSSDESGSAERAGTIPALAELPLAHAVAASAAFPIGIPPLNLQLPVGGAGGGWYLHGSRRAALTLADGGILDNLGTQMLLKRNSGCDSIVVSDAGRREEVWTPRSLLDRIRGLVVGFASLPVLERVLTLISDKQLRQAREGLMGALVPNSRASVRRLIFVRLDQTLDRLILRIPEFHKQRLARRAGLPLPPDADLQDAQLLALGVPIDRIRLEYEELGGDPAVEELNRIPTGLGALSESQVDGLSRHAAWQVRMLRALYW